MSFNVLSMAILLVRIYLAGLPEIWSDFVRELQHFGHYRIAKSDSTSTKLINQRSNGGNHPESFCLEQNTQCASQPQSEPPSVAPC